MGEVMGNQAGLSDSEREVLRALWDRGPGTVREVMDLLTARGRVGRRGRINHALRLCGDRGGLRLVVLRVGARGLRKHAGYRRGGGEAGNDDTGRCGGD